MLICFSNVMMIFAMMKFSKLILLTIYLLINIPVSQSSLFTWFWISAPVLIGFFIELFRLKKPNVSGLIPRVMVVLYPLGLVVFLSEYFATTTDAQAGLASALVPVYQLMIIVLILVVALINYLVTQKKVSA